MKPQAARRGTGRQPAEIAGHINPEKEQHMKQLQKFILILLSIAALAGARIGQAAPAEATLDETRAPL